MTDHTYIRLLHGSTVVAYFAPNFNVSPMGKNELFVRARANGDVPIVRNRILARVELVLQGAFLDSTQVPAAHKAALEALFGTSPVTADMQILRVWKYFLTEKGPFRLYWGDLQFTAETDGAVNIANGVFPVVSIDEFRPVETGGRTRREYVMKLVVGVPR